MNGAIVAEELAKARSTPTKTRMATTGKSQNFLRYFRNSQYSDRIDCRLIAVFLLEEWMVTG